MNDGRSDQSVDQIVGEVRVIREHLHDLIARLQDDRAAWQRMLTDLERRPRLTSTQRSRFRRYADMLARRRTP